MTYQNGQERQGPAKKKREQALCQMTCPRPLCSSSHCLEQVSQLHHLQQRLSITCCPGYVLLQQPRQVPGLGLSRSTKNTLLTCPCRARLQESTCNRPASKAAGRPKIFSQAASTSLYSSEGPTLYPCVFSAFAVLFLSLSLCASSLCLARHHWPASLVASSADCHPVFETVEGYHPSMYLVRLQFELG